MKEFSAETIHKNRWIILAVLIVVPFMGSLDSSIVNVVLPVIKKDLGINLSLSSLIISSYTITIATTIIIFGKLGDLKGKGKIFLVGLVGFIVGSFLCSISPNIAVLIISRIIQGLGASTVMATNQGLIAVVFADNERGRALGISGSAVALGGILGPAIGGIITSYLSWHFIFLINIPIGVIALVVGYYTLPGRNSSTEEKLDKSGSLMFFTAIFIIFVSLIGSQDVGFANIYVIGGSVVGAIILIYFVKFEKSLEAPMLNVSLFKISSLSLNLSCAFIYYFISNSLNLILPFYLTDIKFYSHAEISMIMLVSPLVMFVVAPISGFLSDKIGSKKVTLCGLGLMIAAMCLMIMLDYNTNKGFLVFSLFVFGFASGTFNSPNTNLVMSTVPKEHLGITGSINALVRNLGLLFGTSIATSILYYQMSAKAGFRVGDIVFEYFGYAMRSLFVILAGMAIFAFVLSNIDRKLACHKDRKD